MNEAYPPLIRADAARQMTERQLKGAQASLISPILAHIHERIHIASLNGQYQIYHPLRGLPPQVGLTPQKEKAVWRTLTESGYVVEHRPDPDPGHPASGPYTVVSWGVVEPTLTHSP